MKFLFAVLALCLASCTYSWGYPDPDASVPIDAGLDAGEEETMTEDQTKPALPACADCGKEIAPDISTKALNLENLCACRVAPPSQAQDGKFFTPPTIEPSYGKATVVDHKGKSVGTPQPSPNTSALIEMLKAMPHGQRQQWFRDNRPSLDAMKEHGAQLTPSQQRSLDKRERKNKARLEQNK